MIPKIIHYCWFGGNEEPLLMKRCIESWKKFCPEYEIKKWDENNFDVRTNKYALEAYNMKKWAFVSDYVRLYVLYKYGGIYMDTDVEVIKNIDVFLNHQAFSGFENTTYIPTGIMGAVKKNLWIESLLNYYDNHNFINQDGTLDLTTNVIIITKITQEKYNIRLNNTLQEISKGIYLYPKEYFCPKNYNDGEIVITNKTYTIHHFAGSWLSDEEKTLNCIKYFLSKYLSKKFAQYAIGTISVYRLGGFHLLCKKIKDKIRSFME